MILKMQGGGGIAEVLPVNDNIISTTSMEDCVFAVVLADINERNECKTKNS